MFEQKRFAGRHLLTFESDTKVKLFWKTSEAGVLTLQCSPEFYGTAVLNV